MTKIQSITLPLILLLFSILGGTNTYGDFTIPSYTSLYQSSDNDGNLNTLFDIHLATRSGAVIHYGMGYSHFNFDDTAKGSSRSYNLGLRTNPLNDWVADIDLNYTMVSEQMDIINPSLAILRYFKYFDLQIRGGHRRISLDVTERFKMLLRNTRDEFVDENFWWSMNLGIPIRRRSFLDISYTQFQYNIRFDALSTALAPRLDYHWSTINAVSTFAKYLWNIRYNYSFNRWSTGLSFTVVENEFDESSLKNLVSSTRYSLNSQWKLDIDVGTNIGEALSAQNAADFFSGLGFTYQW